MDLDGFYVKIWKNPDNLEKSGKLSGKIWKNLEKSGWGGWAWLGLGGWAWFQALPGLGWAGLTFFAADSSPRLAGLETKPRVGLGPSPGLLSFLGTYY